MVLEWCGISCVDVRSEVEVEDLERECVRFVVDVVGYGEKVWCERVFLFVV